MPTQTDTPIAQGARQDWRSLPPSVPSVVAAVQTNDGDASVVHAISTANWEWQTYRFSPLSGIVSPVNDASLTAVARVFAWGTGAQTFKLVWASEQISYPDYNYGFGRSTWEAAGIVKDYYTSCVVGAAQIPNLAAEKVNGEHGFWMRGTGWYEVFVTHLARYVDYDYEGGDFAGPFVHNAAALAGAMIGAGLLFREMPALARFMGRWKKGRSWMLRPDEYKKAWRAWREYRHPRFVFLGD